MTAAMVGVDLGGRWQVAGGSSLWRERKIFLSDILLGIQVHISENEITPLLTQ
jgi:hypothetical protein